MSSDLDPLKMRKTHTKSRLGCLQCKARKVKCDELKPACRRCTSTGRECSFREARAAAGIPTPTASTRSGDVASSASSPLFPSLIDSIFDLSTTDEQIDHSDGSMLFQEQYSLLHLQLLNHMTSEFRLITGAMQPHIESVLKLAYQMAFGSQYLMDQLIALAAAHKSTVVPLEHRNLYLRESTKLQTRALAHVSALHDDSVEKDSTTFFLFSVFIGQQVLFEVFSSLTDLATVLDRLVHCFFLHNGIRVTAGKAWDEIRSTFVACGLVDPRHEDHGEVPEEIPGTDCDGFSEHIERIELDDQTRDVYFETVKLLQYLFDSVRKDEARAFTAVSEWQIRVSHRYITLLRERRPEALVLLAHYGVLLHYARVYWAVGDSGRFLIKSITSHLGDYWADWLVWPNLVVDGT